MEFKKFADQSEAVVFIHNKLIQHLGSDPSEEALQSFADEVGMLLTDLKVLLQQRERKTDYYASQVIPAYCKFYPVTQLPEIMEHAFPHWANNKRLYFTDENWRYVLNYKKRFQPVIVDLIEWSYLKGKVTEKMIIDRFGEKIGLSAVNYLLEIDFFEKKDGYYARKNINHDMSFIAQIAFMRADLDIMPHVICEPEFARFDLLTRHGLLLSKKKLFKLGEMLHDFHEKFCQVAFLEEDLEPKVGQFVLNLVAYTRTENTEVKPVYRAEQEQIEAMTKVTQMFAHDVRKPFTMIQSLLQMIDECRNLSQVKFITKKYNLEIEKSLKTLNGMIQDIMGMGAEVKLDRESINLSSLIALTLSEIFRFQKDADIDFEFDLQHQFQIDGDLIKLSRVISNIITNAYQAMGKKGKMWFRSSEVISNDKLFIKICIGNNNSFIPASELPRLFEAFYTNNKKNGTGLGLTIAHKVVKAHGGEIWCQSIMDLGVEFYLTLPAHDQKAIAETSLPLNSRELLEEIELLQDEEPLSKVDQIHDEMLLILKRIALNTSEQLKIAIIDDEKIYCRLPLSYISNFEEIKKIVNIKEFEDGENSIPQILAFDPDLILLDIDLNQRIDGFDVCKLLRSRGFKGKICIHSNRSSFDIQLQLQDAGADLNVPKPISRNQFFKLLLAMPKIKLLDDATKSQQRDKIVVVDDNTLVLESWRRYLPEVLCFNCPEDFYKSIEEKHLILSEISAIVTDFHFDDVDSAYDGLKFAQELRSKKFAKPIYLASGANQDFNDIDKKIISQIIPKNPKLGYKVVMQQSK